MYTIHGWDKEFLFSVNLRLALRVSDGGGTWRNTTVLRATFARNINWFASWLRRSAMYPITNHFRVHAGANLTWVARRDLRPVRVKFKIVEAAGNRFHNDGTRDRFLS